MGRLTTLCLHGKLDSVFEAVLTDGIFYGKAIADTVLPWLGTSLPGVGPCRSATRIAFTFPPYLRAGTDRALPIRDYRTEEDAKFHGAGVWWLLDSV